MKIHFLLTKDLFRGGGIETYTREVGRRLAARGHSVTVYSTRGDDECPDEWQGMRIIWLPRVRPYWAEKCFGALLAAGKALVAEPPDVIHLHSVVAGATAALLRSKRVPCVLQMHGIEWMRTRWGSVARSVLKTMERLSVASTDAITAVSQTQCLYFKSNYSKNCRYIPTAADLKELISPKLIADLGVRSRGYILFAARLVPEKGAHYLIEAFRRLAPEYSLVIAGEAPASRAYQQRLLDLAGEDPKIIFAGHVRGRLLQELFSNAALFVQPSEIEGLSIGLIEAMSYGLPCLASDIPENREVVGEAGLMFQSRDANELGRVLDWSIHHEAACRELGVMARSRVQALFSWDRVVDELEELYERVACDFHTARSKSTTTRHVSPSETIVKPASHRL